MDQILTEQEFIEQEKMIKLKENLENKDLDVQMLGRAIKRRLKKNWDLVTAISGEEGSGKSVLDIHLGRAVDPEFTLKRNLLFDPDVDTMKNFIVDLPRYSYIGADECMKILFKLLWSTKASIYLNVLYSLIRKENKATGLCIPNFMDLNKYFRQHRVRLWIEVIERGTAVMFMRDWSPAAKDKWWLDDMQKKIDLSRKKKPIFTMDAEDKITVLKSSRNYVTTIRFSDLNEEDKRVYKELVDQHKKYDKQEHVERLKPRAKDWFEQRNRAIVGMVNMGMTQLDVSKVIGVTPKVVNDIYLKTKIESVATDRI